MEFSLAKDCVRGASRGWRMRAQVYSKTCNERIRYVQAAVPQLRPHHSQQIRVSIVATVGSHYLGLNDVIAHNGIEPKGRLLVAILSAMVELGSA